MSKEQEILNNTTILFDDIDEYKPKMCIVKEKEENGMYHLKESRDLNEQEILRTFFGLAKYLEKQKCFEIYDSKEILYFEFKNKEVLKMNRLTKDLNTPHDDTTYSDVVKDVVDRENIVLTKLKHYENIEESLGCPLEVVFKALENGIYTIDKTCYPLVNLHFEDRSLYCQAKFKNPIEVHIKDYQKTWWLKDDLTE